MTHLADYTEAEQIGRRTNANRRLLDAIASCEADIARWTRMAERSGSPRIVSRCAANVLDAQHTIDEHRCAIARNNARPLEEWTA